MMFKKGVKLKIAWHTEETKVLADLELNDKIDITQTKVKTITFYHISYIHKTKSYGRVYTTIATEGTEFLCIQPIDEVENLIQIAFQG